MTTVRLAVIGTEADTRSLISSAKRIVEIECDIVPRDQVPLDSKLDEFDAVAFCGLPEGGPAAICDAARSGANLLVDGGFLQSISEAGAIIGACREADVKLMFVQPLRFRPSIQAIRQSLDDGELGEPGLLRIHRWVSGRESELGRLLTGEIDLANYFFDRLPANVYAIDRDNGESRQLIQVHFGFDGGGMALIDVSTSLPEGDDYYSLSLIGGNGSAYAGDHHNVQLVFGGGAALAKPTAEGEFHWTEPLRRFLSALVAPRQGAVSADPTLAALKVTLAVHRSLELGCAMKWQGEDYEPV